MYEEGSRKLSFNWVSLALKLVALGVFVFLLCWLFTRSTNNNNKVVENDTSYINNITSMKEAAFEYFTESNLPENVGGTQKLSLSQMLNQKLLIDFTDDGDSCDINSSYVQATKTADGAYALKVSLDCNNKKDFIVTTIEKTKCIVENNCPPTDNNNNKDENTDKNDTTNSNTNTNNTNNNSSSNNSGTTSKPSGGSSSSSSSQKVTTTVTTKVHVTVSCSTCSGSNNNNNTPDDNKPTDDKKWHYKYIKYSKWYDGYSYDKNAENEKYTETTYNYCEERNTTIYTTGYASLNDIRNKKKYTYTLKLLDFKASQINDIGVSDKSYFGSSLTDYREYMDSRNEHISMVGNTGLYNSSITNSHVFRDSSLKRSNFDFSVSGVYRKGNYYYVDVTIKLKNANNVDSYYDRDLGFELYYVPLKFDINYSYNYDCERDTKANEYKYKNHSISDPETSTYWRHRYYETTWSTETQLNGWEYTGIKEHY